MDKEAEWRAQVDAQKIRVEENDHRTERGESSRNPIPSNNLRGKEDMRVDTDEPQPKSKDKVLADERSNRTR